MCVKESVGRGGGAVSIIPIKLLLWILRLRRGSIWPPDILEISPKVGCQQSCFLSHRATPWDQCATCFGNPQWGSPLPCTVPPECPRMNPAPQGGAPIHPQDTFCQLLPHCPEGRHSVWHGRENKTTSEQYFCLCMPHSHLNGTGGQSWCQARGRRDWAFYHITKQKGSQRP